MKSIAAFIILLILFPFVVVSQSCLPEGITFSSQAQIDSFQNNYPGCTEIEGDVIISGASIYNLNGLGVLNTIGGDLSVLQRQRKTTPRRLEICRHGSVLARFFGVRSRDS